MTNIFNKFKKIVCFFLIFFLSSCLVTRYENIHSWDQFVNRASLDGYMYFAQAESPSGIVHWGAHRTDQQFANRQALIDCNQSSGQYCVITRTGFGTNTLYTKPDYRQTRSYADYSEEDQESQYIDAIRQGIDYRKDETESEYTENEKIEENNGNVNKKEKIIKEKKEKKVLKEKNVQKITQLEENKFKKKENALPNIIPVSMGTGFYLTKNGHIVTNFHVVENCDIVKVFNSETESINAIVLEIDKINDLALIKVKKKPNSFLNIEDQDVKLLQEVVVAGFPMGRKISSSIKLSTGSVTSLSGEFNNFSEFQTDAIINHGNSGGPIVNKYGNVVGVAVKFFRDENYEGFNFGIKSSVLKTFVLSNSIKVSKPNKKILELEDLGKLISDSTTYMQCWMDEKKYKLIKKNNKSKKAFFSNQ